MALKLNLERITTDDLDRAKKEARSFQSYDGPTPPPDTYNVKLTKLWYTKTKTGKDMFKALFIIDETGDLETYNGAPIFHNMVVPSDPSEKAFSVQYDNLDSFFTAVSGGKFTFDDFLKAAISGKIINGKTEKAGDPIQSIGKLKFTGEQTLEVRTEINSYNGRESAGVKRILTSSVAKAEDDEDIDDLDDFDDDFGDDLDD